MAQLLNAVTPGTLVRLNENGIPVQFYVAAQNYESGLNGSGRTLVVRKDCYDSRQWNTNVNAYASSAIDSWLNSTYKNLLDADIRGVIGTTKIKYTPGNGNNTVGTLERAIFLLSATELNRSASWFNVEGTALEIASSLQIAYMNGSAVVQWTRSPYTSNTNYAVYLNTYGSVDYIGCTLTYGSRPAFTLPSTLSVSDDGTVSQYAGPAPTSITTPAIIIMQGNSIPISWDGVSGADSYILQRKADSGEWTQVYAGSDTTFSDTAGSWSTVQYQVCGVFDGTNGAFAQSEVITVLPASSLVISGTDGDLGTITSDISYSVATDTGNPISLTLAVNGAQFFSGSVGTSYTSKIPVMDLPTGTGTIVITATVQASGGPVTVKRTWTYTKQAQTFPGSGGLAQLAQDGQNMFPLTLAEAVKTIGGPWGGNLSTALDKLARAVTYSETPIPLYSQVSVDLSTAQVGDIVRLPENGVMVPFYVASLDYEPMLNTGGTRVLLVRKDVYQNDQWNSSGLNTYDGSTIDNWFNNTYKAMLDSMVQAQLGTTTFEYTPGSGNNTVTTLSRDVFGLSLTELGQSQTYANVEGSALPIANTLKIAYQNDIATTQWTRSPSTANNDNAWRLDYNGSIDYRGCRAEIGYRPCFTLPTTFTATYYVDTAGNVYPSQEYTTAGDFYDLWGNVIPTVKIETGSYTGTGTYGKSNPNTLTFGFEPKLVLVFAGSSLESFMIIPAFAGNPDGNGSSFIIGGSNACQVYPVSKNVDGNSLNWWVNGITQPHIQFNHSGRTYNYIAIG